MRQALEFADPGATCWAASVWDPTAAVHPETVDILREQAQGALRSVAGEFPTARPQLIRGHAVTGLLQQIIDREADLVCVGSHGTSRRAGILFGSVASAMVHHAPCAVLIARKADDGKVPELIVHANDGSAESLAAARIAGRIAARTGSTIVTLHVGKAHGLAVAEEAVAIIESSGQEPVMRVEHGSPHRRLVEVARNTGAALIVMPSLDELIQLTEGEGAAAAERIAMSGVALARTAGCDAEATVQRTYGGEGYQLDVAVHVATVPVLVIPNILLHEEREAAVDGPIIVGYDGSPGSRRAVEEAGSLFEGRKLTVAAVGATGDHASDVPGIETAELVTLEQAHGEGAVADRLVRLAAQRQAAAVVVGSRGRSAAREILLGSVAMGVLHRAQRPVLVVPHQRFE